MSMISPASHEAVNHQIIENKANGQGYWAFTPEAPTPLAEGLQGISEYGTFTETKGILEQARQFGSVLVEGPPGAGKSHFVRELQEGAIINNVPTFCLTMHINQGKRTGIDNIREPFQAFRDAAGENGGLVILDNIDMVGYKGGGRRGPAVAQHTGATLELLQEVNADPRLVTVATGHDEIWRAGKWTWGREDVDQPAQAVLENFGARAVFEGKVSLVGLTHILYARGNGYSLGDAARTVRQLSQTGRANFFHANHLNVTKYLVDPGAAIEEIEAGRRERQGL